MQSFGSVGIRSEMRTSFPSCGKALPADMKLIDSGYEMVTGTWGEVDVGTTDTAKYKEYENADGTATFSVQEWAFETEYSKRLLH